MTFPVLGLGPGGCGMRSLAWLLDQQPGRACRFEPAIEMARWADGWEYARLVAPQGSSDAVGWYFLPYAHRMLQENARLRVIGLEHDPDVMAQRLLAAFGDWRNPFCESTDSLNDRSLLRLYPRLGIPDCEAAVYEYLRLYSSGLCQLQAYWPDRVLLGPTDMLNDTLGQLHLLQFAGVARPVLFDAGVDLQRDGITWPTDAPASSLAAWEEFSSAS